MVEATLIQSFYQREFETLVAAAIDVIGSQQAEVHYSIGLAHGGDGADTIYTALIISRGS